MSPQVNRSGLRRLTKYLGLMLATAMLYVLLDFTIDLRPSRVQSSYQLSVEEWPIDQARILRRDNQSILVIRRSAETIAQLNRALADLQDPGSKHSHQPVFATNALRSKHPELFVSYATGTDLGCGLEVVNRELKEICGDARYDFAGRALQGAREFQNLTIPDYNFSDNFTKLTIRP